MPFNAYEEYDPTSQKEVSLPRDAEVLYRVEQAPERQIWYIDVGSMPPGKVNEYLDSIKKEIDAKRLPEEQLKPAVVSVQLKPKVEHAPTSLPSGLNDLLF